MATEEKTSVGRRSSSEFDDVELALWRREVKRSSRRGIKVVLSACVVTLVLFLVYVKTPGTFSLIGAIADSPTVHATKHHDTVKDRSKHVGTLEKRGTAEADVCTSPVCVAHAKEVKTYLAPNYKAIDPCVDFDEYSCAGWRASHVYRPEQSCQFSGLQQIHSDLK
jgi:hypothetical protein